MKTQLLHTAAMAIALLFSNLPTVMGIENLQIRVQGMNAVLSWPSVEGETFLMKRLLGRRIILMQAELILAT